MALGLQNPWYVESVSFEMDEKSKQPELHLYLNFERGAKFPFPNGDFTNCPVHDTVQKTWRHLNFFQYKAYIHARVPRVKSPSGAVQLITVPWARPGSGFTLLFEAFVLLLVKEQPVSVVARTLSVHDTLLWRMVSKYVERAREEVDLSEVACIGADETSKKGHNYITVFADIKGKRVIHIEPGKSKETVYRFYERFIQLGGIPDNVKVITTDMSLGYLNAFKALFKNSHSVIDKFHVMKHMNEALDEVRKDDVKELKLKRTKYLVLKNYNSLKAKERRHFSEVMAELYHRATGKVYRMRCTLQQIFLNVKSREEAEIELRRFCSWLGKSRITRLGKLKKLIKNHMDEILNYWSFRYTNAHLEGFNSIIQNIKRRSRGFRNDKYFETMIYLVCGGLDLVKFCDVKAWK